MSDIMTFLRRNGYWYLCSGRPNSAGHPDAAAA
jgi:hypothetical protein